MATLEALYDRRCRYPICYIDVGEVALISRGLVDEAQEKFWIII